MEKQVLQTVDVPPPDLRSAMRRSTNIDCILEVDGAPFPARILDRSAEGAFVECKGVIHPGSEATLLVRLPCCGEVLDLSLQTEVIHSGRYLQGDRNFIGLGLRFKDIPPDVRRKMEEDDLLALSAEPTRKYIFFSNGGGPR